MAKDQAFFGFRILREKGEEILWDFFMNFESCDLVEVREGFFVKIHPPEEAFAAVI